MYNPQLETFLRVADAGSFNKAAEVSYITPTAVIKQINLLEADLDVKLFERTHRGVKLTKAGNSLYNDTKYIIQYCKDSVTRAKNAMQEDTNVIRIGISPMTPAQILVELWPKIHEICPEIKFRLVPFENTPENAKEILANLGTNIDVVAGIFDETMFELRQCAGFELSREPLCCAVSVQHRLAEKNTLTVEDLYGENLLLMHRGWSHHVDSLRDDIWENHNQIHIIDFDFYDVSIFNRCESSNDVLMAVKTWTSVHPLLKIIPVAWEHYIPYGLLHSPTPSETVSRFLAAIQTVLRQ
ncbi:MAG: LysR family transcriptional regulator [Eubacteriales bacterium]|nr:LysR family transcriptional regulator [Eubacteriales bacterium]